MLIKKEIKKIKTSLGKILPRLSYLLEYKISYLKFINGILIKKSIPNNLETEYDLVFVIFGFAKNWILEAICREIATYFPGKYYFHYSEKNIPPAKAYFIAHYSFVPACLKQNPHMWGSKILVWYTHPRNDLGISNEELIYVLNKVTKVISTCSKFVQLLISQGLKPERVTYILGAADPQIFQPHQRHNGAVGFCTAFYHRKEPERIFNIIQSMTHRKFILLGKGWEKYEKFPQMKSLANFSYIEAPYSDYPNYYALMDVFVSPAKLEGGPIPLVESMMCNVVPVASNTGFAPDLIAHGDNGFIFNIDSSVEKICDLIDRAFYLKADIRKTVEHLHWQNFSQQVQRLLS